VSTRAAPKGKASASVDLGRKVDKLRKCRLTLTRHVLQDQYFLFPHLLNSRARRVAARDSLRRGASLREDESKREIHESGGGRRRMKDHRRHRKIDVARHLPHAFSEKRFQVVKIRTSGITTNSRAALHFSISTRPPALSLASTGRLFYGDNR